MSCPSDFKRYLFTLYHIIYLAISIFLYLSIYLVWMNFPVGPHCVKKCPYLELFWSVVSRIWTEYGEKFCISLYSVRMQENADQNNSEWGDFLCGAFRKKFITWAKCVTLTILTKIPTKIDKFFSFAKSNLCKNSFTYLRHFISFLLFVFIGKKLDISAK